MGSRSPAPGRAPPAPAGSPRSHALRTPLGVYYYATEYPGHVTGLVNGGGQVTHQCGYTPWGEAESVSEYEAQPLRYMARELDPATGLYYVRARWYDPVLARFVSEDPIGLAGGINPYAYVGNSPTNFRDPSGLDPTIGACIAALKAGGASDSFAKRACGVNGGSFTIEGIVATPYWPFSTDRKSGFSAGFGERGHGPGGFLYTYATPGGGDGHQCPGGFTPRRCESIRTALTHLRTHSNSMCRLLGLRSSHRFIRGSFRLERGSHYGRVDAVPPKTDSLFLTRHAFASGELANTIAHEEAHHLGFVHPGAGDMGDNCAGPI